MKEVNYFILALGSRQYSTYFSWIDTYRKSRKHFRDTESRLYVRAQVVSNYFSPVESFNKSQEEVRNSKGSVITPFSSSENYKVQLARCPARLTPSTVQMSEM